ncbi:MAG: Phosphopantetheine adenylyltransferase [Phycisphaerae bacterium]|nr:Phosphopantetheine adenylyltransferase [Phycisphaerae bacterium]
MNREKIAIFPGTFDPITRGHLDVIQRGARLFDRLIVAVGQNPEKAPLFTAEERVGLIRKVVADLPNVSADSFRGLTVEFARKCGATAILRGIRSTIDLSHELRAAYTNRAVSNVETVFVLTTEEYSMISSTLIKQVADLGGDVSKLVPGQIIEPLLARLKTVRKTIDPEKLDD